MIRAVVLTISDSAARGEREDRSGPALREFMEAQGWSVAVPIEVLPDDVDRIAGRLIALADSGDFDVIVTTGGTGVAARDVTPEATARVVDRQIPGIAEVMRFEGRKSTPYAVLSRGIAGHRGRTPIVNVPGSPRGAVESLEAIAALIPHVIALLHGNTKHD